MMLKLKLQYFGHLMRRVESLEKTLMWKELGAGGEGDDRGWDGWMASRTRWPWVWVNSGSWWWTGRPVMLQPMGGKESDTTEQLNNNNKCYKQGYIFLLKTTAAKSNLITLYFSPASASVFSTINLKIISNELWYIWKNSQSHVFNFLSCYSLLNPFCSYLMSMNLLKLSCQDVAKPEGQLQSSTTQFVESICPADPPKNISKIRPPVYLLSRDAWMSPFYLPLLDRLQFLILYM